MSKQSTEVKVPPRCASPEQEDAVGRASRARDEEDAAPEAGKVKRRPLALTRKKEFAWMDSDDEASDNSDEEQQEEAPPKEERKQSSRKEDSDVEERRRETSDSEERAQDEPAQLVPSCAAEVQSLGQMMRLMESWQRQRGRILRLPMAELSQVCQACARVKYFDSQSFADIIAAVKVHLRSYVQLKADDVGGVLSGLAADKEVFDLAASAMNRTAGHLQRPARKVILDAFKKVNHRSNSLREMSEHEAKARYDEKCSEAGGDAPLDLGTEAFYPSRSTAIEKRLSELSAMAPSALAEEVRQNFQRLHGQRIRGIRWDRYDAQGQFLQSSKEASPGREKGTESESSEDASKVGNGRRVLWTNAGIEVAGEDRQLAAAAGAIGGRALAAAFRLLCEDYNSAGLPDLLLWSWHATSAPRARFVEVKSERDTLARRQRLWLSTLRGAGAEAEVCHVRDNPVEESRVVFDVHKEIPAWEVIVGRTLDVLRTTAAEGTPGRSKPFRNLITDRDGTTNNYCDRYASSVQSAYNAAWLSNFSRHCVDNAVFITAAPLGGRPSAEGLMELCVAPRGYFIYTGSKGREYYSDATQQLLEAEELPKEQRELVEELHRRILALCQQPGNTKFLGIGSGLQRKFGEVTMARNDPAGTVPEPESRRFMAAVRRVKEELDPDGTGLDLHDTGTDMEIFPRVMGGRPSFDKGDGVQRCNLSRFLNAAMLPTLIAILASSSAAAKTCSPLKNRDIFSTVEVEVGTPSQRFELVADTGTIFDDWQQHSDCAVLRLPGAGLMS
eukprot:s1971_g7.t1